jgi:hypothetical protein
MPKSRISSRRKTRKTQLVLSVKLPSKRVREKFLIIYELEGCQKAVNFLTDHYRVPRMHIILNGKRVGKKKSNRWIACHENNKAYFTKEGLNKKIILHELYHHLIDSNNLDFPLRIEEKYANNYSRRFMHY